MPSAMVLWFKHRCSDRKNIHPTRPNVNTEWNSSNLLVSIYLYYEHNLEQKNPGTVKMILKRYRLQQRFRENFYRLITGYLKSFTKLARLQWEQSLDARVDINLSQQKCKLVEDKNHRRYLPGSNRRYTDRYYLSYKTASPRCLVQARLVMELASYLRNLVLFPGLNAAMNARCNGWQNHPNLEPFHS